MRLVGGSIALDFVNSRSGPEDDALTGYADVVAWARYTESLSKAEAVALHRVARQEPRGAEAAFRRCLRIRDCLDGVFRELARGGRASKNALAELRDHEIDALGAAELDGGYAWSWRHDHSLLRPVRPFVHAAVELLTAGRLDRVKGCGSCSFLFLDESKNRSRRWCSMEDCGTAEKIRRYVARRARQ